MLCIGAGARVSNNDISQATMCWVLDADINLGGGTIKAVGRHATGFQGTLYGNKHVIKNGTVQYETWIGNTAEYACGLFHYINGGKVYDLNLDSTLKLTMKTNVNDNVYCYMGSLSSVADNATIVGVNSNVSINVAQTGTTKSTYCAIGGVVGHCRKGSNKLIKSNYNGNLYFKTTANAYLGPDDKQFVGGLIGCLDSDATVDQCSASGTFEQVYSGGDIGGIIGVTRNTGSRVIKITNIVLNVSIKATHPDSSPGAGILIGWETGGSLNASSTLSNVYVLKGELDIDGSKSTCLGWIYGLEQYSNVCLPVSSGVTTKAGGGSADAEAGVAKKGSTSAVVTAANSNPAISNNYTLTDAGGITSRARVVVVNL